MNEQGRSAVLGVQRAVNAAWERQQGLLTEPPPNAGPPGIGGPGPAWERALTPDELAIARSVFGNSLDTSKIKLVDGGLGLDVAVSLPDGKITFPKGNLTNPPEGFKSWLIHELTHQWQYQHGYSLPETAYHAAHGDYDYGGDQGLREGLANGKSFESFNTEEQGDILRNYYKLLAGEKPLPDGVSDISVYEPYVNSVRNGTTKEPPRR